MTRPVIHFEYENTNPWSMTPFQRMIFFYIVGFLAQEQPAVFNNEPVLAKAIFNINSQTGLTFKFTNTNPDLVRGILKQLPEFFAKSLVQVHQSKVGDTPAAAVYMQNLTMSVRPESNLTISLHNI